MYFPPPLELLKLCAPLALSGVAAAVVGFSLWCASRRSAGPAEPTQPALRRDARRRQILVAGVALIAACQLLFGLVLPIWTTIRFQHDISRVVEIRVERLGERDVDSRRTIIIRDPATIEAWLSTLSTSRAWWSSHEHGLGGYRLRLRFRGESRYSHIYITAHRNTSRRSDQYVVVPHVGRSARGCVGEYTCPAFFEWLDANSDAVLGLDPKSVSSDM